MATSITITIPNTIFAQPTGNLTADKLDANWTAIVTAVSGIALAAGDITAGTGVTITTAAAKPTISVAIPRGLIGGLGLANNAGDATNDIDIAVGSATDSGNAVVMVLSSALTKQLDAVWAVGTNQGMRASGAAIANTTYHIFLIRRPDTGVVDVAADTSATGANIAANTNSNYTQIRRIGSIVRAGGTILAFTQFGDYFRWSASILDVNTTNPGAAAVTSTLTVPTGVNVFALVNAGVLDTTPAARYMYLSDLAASDEAPAGGSAPLAQLSNCATSELGFWGGEIRTNTSAQIRYRLSGSGANTAARIATLGWRDTRGRDS